MYKRAKSTRKTGLQTLPAEKVVPHNGNKFHFFFHSFFKQKLVMKHVPFFRISAKAALVFSVCFILNIFGGG
ncbi:hypothetical protein C7N43_27540 [Sphingobacteriales bacterium UPWRP_1]|nr:hypothetical protein BVG80_05020 [Sphingobacteriales bacterium TSM_CSM]PSJ73756.1 hypothetical protein C7N43_27540 [Sphingobacteriales bacterium UPWRP_1]